MLKSVLTGSLRVEEFRKHAYQTVDFIVDYHRDVEKFPVRSQVQVSLAYKGSLILRHPASINE